MINYRNAQAKIPLNLTYNTQERNLSLHYCK